MEKKIIIDVKPIVYKLWEEYNGDLKQKQWSKKFKVDSIVTDKVKSKIVEIENLYHVSDVTYSFNFDDRTLSMNFKWLENININEWNHETSEDIRKISHFIWSNGLTCYER